MKTTRGLSQVVFNLLPEQTVDIRGQAWKVDRWVEPRTLPVDLDVVRKELRRAIYPWSARNLDNGLAERLDHHNDVRVVAPSEDGGVRVEPFPENWYCRKCWRVEQRTDKPCRCGAHTWAQLPLVAYHECGRIETPWIPRCKEHKQVRVELSRSTAVTDLRFKCPECDRETSPGGGFPFRKCECGNGTYSHNVHRAAVVFTPRSAVIVNPPLAAEAAALKTETGAKRVLDWVLDGMEQEKPLKGGMTTEALVANLIEQGVPEAAARAAAEAAARQGGVQPDHETPELDLPSDQETRAIEAALRLAYATASGRTRISDLAEQAGPATKPRYEVKYPAAIKAAGLASVELLEDFPILNACYGYTRGGRPAGETPLQWFRTGSGTPRIHGQLSRTEALLFRLDPMAVFDWLAVRHPLGQARPADDRQARLAILEAAAIPEVGVDPSLDTVGADLLRLVHSYAHRVMRRFSSFAGIDRDSLSEYLVPEHLAFIIYATAHGDFVLGGLQALFEQDLAEALDDVLHGEHRCPLDPGCTAHGGACVACLHVGEPACRRFNQFLDRRTLFGASGFLRP